jgi:uracil-DNA glycosylase family 4
MRNFESDLKHHRLEAQTFEEVIFGSSKEIIRHLYHFEAQEVSEPKTAPKIKEATELTKVIDSFEQFAQNVKSLDSSAPGVSLLQIDQLHHMEEFFNPADCLSYFSTRSNLTNESENLAMICLVSSSDPEHQSLNKFIESEAGILFSKMVDSFKLEKKRVALILHAPPVHQIDFTKGYQGLAKQEFEMILSTVLNLKPRFLVSFGGLSTNFLRQKKENLSNVHGKFYSIKVSYGPSAHTFEHFPLFHPSLLLASPSNKKIAWEDMKQLINKL